MSTPTEKKVKIITSTVRAFSVLEYILSNTKAVAHKHTIHYLMKQEL